MTEFIENLEDIGYEIVGYERGDFVEFVNEFGSIIRADFFANRISAIYIVEK